MKPHERRRARGSVTPSGFALWHALRVPAPTPTSPCQYGDPPCDRAADYAIRAVEEGPGRRRTFCAEHIEEGTAAARRSAELTGIDYRVEPLREGLPPVALWPSDRRATLRFVVLAAVVVLAVVGFAIIAPVMIRT